MEYHKNLDLNDIVYWCEIDNIEKTEQWKNVIGYEELYMISNLGRIKSLDRKYWSIGNNSFSIKKEAIRKLSISNCGYVISNLTINKIQKNILVHRLVAIHFILNLENKPQVNHINGVKTDNRAENLEWNTTFENMAHAFNNGLVDNRGSGHAISKLTNEQVLQIRSSNLSCKKLGEIYSVHISLISRIKLRKAWIHI